MYDKEVLEIFKKALRCKRNVKIIKNSGETEIIEIEDLDSVWIERKIPSDALECFWSVWSDGYQALVVLKWKDKSKSDIRSSTLESVSLIK